MHRGNAAAAVKSPAELSFRRDREGQSVRHRAESSPGRPHPRCVLHPAGRSGDGFRPTSLAWGGCKRPRNETAVGGISRGGCEDGGSRRRSDSGEGLPLPRSDLRPEERFDAMKRGGAVPGTSETPVLRNHHRKETSHRRPPSRVRAPIRDRHGRCDPCTSNPSRLLRRVSRRAAPPRRRGSCPGRLPFHPQFERLRPAISGLSRSG